MAQARVQAAFSTATRVSNDMLQTDQLLQDKATKTVTTDPCAETLLLVSVWALRSSSCGWHAKLQMDDCNQLHNNQGVTVDAGANKLYVFGKRVQCMQCRNVAVGV